MHRARLQLLIAVACVGALAVAGVAHAWHTGSTFENAPGAGGGGGFYYTASPRERGWNCTACHIDRGGPIDVTVQSNPATLFEDGYEPLTDYEITVTLTEKFGLATGLSNHNGMALTVVEAGTKTPAGELGGYVAGEFFARGDNIIATTGQTAGQTQWTFVWTAPEAGTGDVGFYLGVVDGNGAETPPDENLTDPFGDGVFMFERILAEQ